MQPLPPEDYSGEVLQYKILLDNRRKEMCAAASSLCLVQVPAEVQDLSVSAVTSYGTSPPAKLDLRHTGKLILYIVISVISVISVYTQNMLYILKY